MAPKQLEERIGRPVPGTVGLLRDHELVFNKLGTQQTGYANIRPREGDRVYGVLYPLTEQELERLDRKEGVPGHYRRQTVVVETDAGPMKAVCYVAASDKVCECLKPSKDYLRSLVEGARAHGLPPEYVQRLEAQETANEAP